MQWRQRKTKKPFSEKDSVIDKLASINGIDDVFSFMYPTEDDLINPYSLKNIDKARDRIVEAIEKDQFIVVHLDIDSDGANSGALFHNFLRKYTDRILLIHNQRSQGHGLYVSKDKVPENTDLLIVLDSSSNETETCKEMQDRGIDVIIIDHHMIEKENPYAILVNPQQDDCKYENKEASGSLLTWKLTQVLDDYFHESYSDELIDLAALGLYSDLMSVMIPENRYLVSHMLDNIHNIGLKAILKVIGKENNKLSAQDIGYSVAPFINATTRFDKIEMALELLTTDDQSRALEIASEIKNMNDERKVKQKEAAARLIPQINPEDKCIVLVDGSLGKGFNGLLANDLANLYQRPVVILGENEDNPDEYHGSFRSFGFFDFLGFASRFPEVLYTGGHKSAGGIGCKKSDLEALKWQLNHALKNEKFEQVIYYDLNLEPEEVSEKLISQVQEFCRISGKGFNEAKFQVKDLVIVSCKVIGSGDTLKIGCIPESDTWFMNMEDYDSVAPSIVLMKFKATQDMIDEVKVGQKLEAIGSLNLNEWIKWKPRREVIKTKQMFIDDFKIVG